MRSSHNLDRIAVSFDDDRLVANAGLLLPATLGHHLGLGGLVDSHLNLGEVIGSANAGDKLLTLVHSALAGGDCIDDADALRAGGTAAVLGHRVKAPSTLGTFLRGFTGEQIHQLDAVSAQLLARGWAAGAGPGTEPFTIDLDSTHCETYGLAKEGGSDHNYTGARGYHPLLATGAVTGDVLHSRLRNGNSTSSRGGGTFLTETFARVRGARASGQLTVRADSGFYTHAVAAARKHNVRFSITVRLYPALRAVIEAIDEKEWTAITYWMAGAAVAETSYVPFAKQGGTSVRLIVRRVQRLAGGAQLSLMPSYEYHAFITDRTGEMLVLEADHRRHAVVENAIRDLKYGMGLNHLPSGKFKANAAWLAVQVIAHNLARWTVRLGLKAGIVNTKTLRRQLFSLPGRLTRSARRLTLHFPTRWPWAIRFVAALTRLRAIPLPT